MLFFKNCSKKFIYFLYRKAINSNNEKNNKYKMFMSFFMRFQFGSEVNHQSNCYIPNNYISDIYK